MAAIVDGAEPAAEPTEEDVAAMFSLSKKKKKKKRPKADDEAGVGGAADGAHYAYETLLERVMQTLREKNPSLEDKQRVTMKPPQLMRVGTKKTLWTNFNDICTTMNRDPGHVFQYFMAELGTDGSIDGSKRLVIRGKFVPKYIESLLRKYIGEYVTCNMCRSPHTTLTRDSVSRLHFQHCKDCGSSRSATNITAGFHAQTRSDRRAARS